MIRVRAVLAGAALGAAIAGPAGAQRMGTDVFGYVGYSRATFTDVGAADVRQEWVNGATGGVGLRHPIAGPAGLRTELLLARRGGAFGVDLDGEEAQLSLDLVYLEVPLQLQFQSYERGRQVRPFAFAGVVPSFKLGCDAEARAPSVGVFQRPCADVLEEDAEWFDLGAAGGAGVEIRRGRALLQFQVRYFQSFTDLTPNIGAANRSFAFLLGVGM